MMMLGDILKSANNSAPEFQAWLARSDSDFVQSVNTAAASANTDSVGLARFAVAEFDRFADENAWSGLLRAIRDSADPGMAGLMVMIHWHMARTAAPLPAEA